MMDWSVFDLVLDIISVIAAVAIVCLAMPVFHDHPKYSNGFHAKQHKIAVSVCITCYTISMIAVHFYLILGDANKVWFACLTGFIIYALFGIYQSYILFILKEYTTLKAPHYKSAPHVYGSIIIILFHITLFIINLRIYKDAEYIASIILTYLFCSKLLQLSFITYNNEPSTEVKTPNKIDHQENVAQMIVFSAIMAVSSASFIILALISIIYGFTLHFGAMYALIIDLTVNVFCIYLYDISKNIYKYLCKSTFHQ